MKTITNERAETLTDLGRLPATDPQLELGFAGAAAACRTTTKRRDRHSQARWWFQRMRQLVDCACEWQRVSAPRPEQIWFPNSYRSMSLAPQNSGEQRQLCE
jgi:hypothetical protein